MSEMRGVPVAFKILYYSEYPSLVLQRWESKPIPHQLVDNICMVKGTSYQI